jgi:hypothetical protein
VGDLHDNRPTIQKFEEGKRSMEVGEVKEFIRSAGEEQTITGVKDDETH